MQKLLKGIAPKFTQHGSEWKIQADAPATSNAAPGVGDLGSSGLHESKVPEVGTMFKANHRRKVSSSLGSRSREFVHRTDIRIHLCSKMEDQTSMQAPG